MTREEIEKAAIENRYYYLNIAETKKIAEPKAVAFAIEIANAALEEAATVVETKAVSKPGYKDEFHVVDRRKGQPSISCMLISKALRALKIKEPA